MRKELLHDAERYISQNQRRRVWRRIVRVMACIVVFCTTYALILPAITMEKYSCGMEEHTHGESCYEKVEPHTISTLACTYESIGVHSHTLDCYDSEANLRCGQADFVVHTHDSSCVDALGVIVCQIPEITEHEHTDGCYETEEAAPAHVHEEACYATKRGELICQTEEREGHTHGDTCFTQGQLLCALTEGEDHSHGTDCYEWLLTCELAEEEGHLHTDSCYELVSELICQQEEEAEDVSEPGEPVLICEKEVIQLHSHDDELCYETYQDKNGNEQKRLICEELEILEHIHGESCFVTEVVEAEAADTLTCTETDETHEHTDRCYGTWVLTCELDEHTHTEECHPDDNSEEAPIVPPECNCGNALLDLISHADGCARKAFCRETASAYAAVQLEEFWKYLPEDVQAFILTYLSWTDQQKLAELNNLLPDIVEAENGKLTIEGKLPRNATVEVKAPDQEVVAELMDQLFPDMGEFFSVAEFHDISILSGGEKWQPGTEVTVTLQTEVPTDGKVRVLHILDDSEAIRSAIADGVAKNYTVGETTVYYTELSSEDGEVTINDDGTISFETDSFSIFAVNGYNESVDNALKIEAGSTVQMIRGEERYFVWQINAGEDGDDSKRGTWTISSGDEYVDIEVYNSCLNTADHAISHRFAFWWLKVTARQPGIATLKYQYVDSGGVFHTEEFTVEVLETTEAMYIDDQIAENGCLVPMFVDGRETTGITFIWSRDDGLEVSERTLDAPYAVVLGAVNVSMDRGGVDADRVMTTYTVKATDQSGRLLGEASFTVPYGNEVINGGFEYPIAVAENTGFANGTKGLFWATTMPADLPGIYAWDVEYLNTTYDTSTNSFIEVFGIVKPADGVVGVPDGSRNSVQPDFDLPDGGVQLAEINASNPGALYQDVLTSPGAEMYWSLAHRARNYHPASVNSYWNTSIQDTMYVIIAPSADVQHIKTQAQLDALIAAAGGILDGTKITRTVDGHEISYSIRKLTSGHTQWNYYDNNTVPYPVDDDEYMTRFFFAAGPTYYDSWSGAAANVKGTVGNLIDAVSFSDDMPWCIEYYVNGELQTSLTESGKVELNREGIVYLNREAQNLGSPLLSEYTLVESKINGRPYGGTVLKEVYAKHNVLQLYFESYGVTVTKEVNITNFEQLTFVEKQELKAAMADYQVVFELVEDGEVVCTATVTVDPETRYGTATFVDTEGNKFLPDRNKTYVIREAGAPPISGAYLISKAEPSAEITGELVFAHTAVNVYEMELYKTATILKTDGNGMPLANAEFSLVDVRKDEVIATVTTADNGGAELSNLRINRLYKLTETKAPAGYYLKTNSVYFTLTLKGVIFTDASGNPLNGNPPDTSASGHTITIVNYTGYELPDTGGAGTYLYTMGGALLTCAAILLYIHNLKRRKEERPSF